MNGVQALKAALDASHFWYQATVADLTPEWANFLPPGKGSPISANIVHVIQREDYIIAQLIQDGLPLWEREGWGQRLAITRMYELDETVGRHFKMDPAVLTAYIDMVYAQTEGFYAHLRDEDLDREIDTGPDGRMPVGQILSVFLLGNNFAHTGEISAIKGLQGAKGYPF